MSCTCNNTPNDQLFACPCDSFQHPLPLVIGAGLSDLPRQVAGFPEFRRAMLYALRDKYALNQWRARQPEDLGVMLLEMWAYICDSLSFYDKVISQEEYLRTALRRPSLRRLVALLGYLPRPAIAAGVYMAAMAEGRQLIKLPAGTAFRSGAFAGSPPQVFELEDECPIHPFTNKWNIISPHRATTPVPNTDTFLILPKTEINPGQPALLLDLATEMNSEGVWINKVESYTGIDRTVYRKLKFEYPTQLPVQYPLAQLQLLLPGQSTGLWTMSVPGTPASIFADPVTGSIVLNSLQRQIKKGEYILVTREKETRWFRVISITEESRLQNGGDAVIINGNSFTLPGISVPVTKLMLDRHLNHNERKAPAAQNWDNSLRAELTVHFNLQHAGVITDEPKTTLSPADPLFFEGRIEKPLEAYDPGLFLLTDKNLQAAKVKGAVDFGLAQLKLNQGESWNPELTLPVEIFGNIVKASRGETVSSEILGSGNASEVNQVFKLKKKPLTYLPSPSVANDQGVQNTLTVWVNGIKWKEAASFFNKKPTDEIYIVRQNDEGDSLVIFGDGIRGRRLPSGNDNITAAYRFGAGAMAPPAGVVNQISNPVTGLRSVNNPLPAGGGADAESAEGVRRYAPRSILTLGRAVSMMDMEAIAAAVSGVKAVQAQWRWHGERQCPVAQIWYIGDSGIEAILVERLRGVTDPVTLIEVEQALAVPSSVKLDIVIDDRYAAANVMKALRSVLADPLNGLLSPSNVGIGQSIFRSRIFSAAIAVEGVLSVRNIMWNDDLFSAFAVNPGAGKYFDFGENGIELNGNN